MDYQIVFQNPHLLVVIILIIFSVLPYSLAIVNRDLVLTPKQGLQLSGKRILYEESTNNDFLHNNDTAGTRPWERTLKHVTYLTLFTNDPNGIITENFSKVKEYNEFLQSPYVRSQKVHDSRFGDIVTLAQGRLVTTTNGSYHFIEGNCDYECARDSNIVAMWHVQKIRHRDTADRKYHYEMKFSVSPWTAKSPTETVVRGGPNKRTIMDEKRSNMQTFIQKEDDYPQSFTKIVSEQDEDFADRRFDAARNFRQVNQYQQPQQVTPIPQSTFLRGVYHPHPPPPLQQQIPERLNIGEYFKGSYSPKATSKIELFPNLLNMMIGKTHNLLAPPTTFRPPTHPMKFPRPEIYTLPQQQIHEFSKFPDYHHHSHEQFTHKGPIQGAQYQIQGFPKFPEYHQHIKEQYVQQGPTQGPIQGPIQGPQEFPKFSEYHHQHSQEQFAQKGPTQNPQLQVQEFPKFSEYHHQHSQEQFTQKGPTQNPLVTHHYHHHFFMPNNSAANIDQAIHHSGEHKIVNPTELYKNEVTEVITPLPYTTNLYDKHATTLRQHNLQQHHYQQQQQQQHYQKQNYQQQNYQHIQEPLPPAPQKFIFPTTQIEQHRVVHVTPATPLRKPQYQHYYKTRPLTLPPEYTTGNVPLFISYPAPVNEEERADVPTPRNKPFLHSQPLDDTIHYSEPDPLYAHTTNQQEKEEEERFNSAGEDEHENDSQEPQLESPEHYTTSRGKDTNKDHSDSVEAQLPAPNKVQNDQHQSDEAQVQEDSTQSQTKQNLLEQKTSQTSTSYKISTEKTTSNTIKTEASNSIITATNKPKTFPSRVQRISLKTATTTASTTTTSTTTTKKPKTSTKKLATTEKEKLSTSTTSKPRKHFVSTSSTETPLRTISRYRNSYARTSTSTTTTTEKPVLKWKPRRKSSNGKSMTLNNSTTQESQIEEIDNLDDNDEDDKDDIKAKESNNHQVTKLFMLTTRPTTEMSPDSTTEMSNDITSSTSTMSSLLLSSPQIPLATQSVTEIYEVLTQKSVSKSVSLKVGNNGEEIPVIIDDEENEVKKV